MVVNHETQLRDQDVAPLGDDGGRVPGRQVGRVQHAPARHVTVLQGGAPVAQSSLVRRLHLLLFSILCVVLQ